MNMKKIIIIIIVFLLSVFVFVQNQVIVSGMVVNIDGMLVEVLVVEVFIDFLISGGFLFVVVFIDENGVYLVEFIFDDVDMQGWVYVRIINCD